jgi:hypothetical protein
MAATNIGGNETNIYNIISGITTKLQDKYVNTQQPDDLCLL